MKMWMQFNVMPRTDAVRWMQSAWAMVLSHYPWWLVNIGGHMMAVIAHSGVCMANPTEADSQPNWWFDFFVCKKDDPSFG